MSRPVRLGAVSYLNARPLVFGLDQVPELFTVRYDVPSVCAERLERGEIDLGLVPSIAHLDRQGDLIVPGVCIASDGPVASVALFTRKPPSEIRSVALDAASRTSAVLTQILCEWRFGISPAYIKQSADLDAMLAVADAALVIGDRALFIDPRAHRADKIDLGLAWSEMTGLPFVWAFWAGRPDAADAEVVTVLQQAAESGVVNSDRVADAYCGDDEARRDVARRYLRENLVFRMTPRAIEGLQAFYREARALRLFEGDAKIEFFEPDQRWT
jgi:chorismate dehydratase